MKKEEKKKKKKDTNRFGLGCISTEKTYPYLFLDDTLSLLKNVYVAIENKVVLKMGNFLHVFVLQFWAYYVIDIEYLCGCCSDTEIFQR